MPTTPSMRNSSLYFPLLLFAVSACARVFAVPSLQAVAAEHVFAAGVVSTGREFATTFSPDGRTVLFTRSDSVTRRTHIFASRFSNGNWQPATPVRFSRSEWSDLDPSVTPDGERLYFASARPHASAAGSGTDMDIWYSEASDSGWREPTWIPELSSSGKEGSPTLDRNGTICFFFPTVTGRSAATQSSAPRMDRMDSRCRRDSMPT
jgi:hypothetical protein